MRAAGIYIRISSDRGGQRAGVRRQLEDCQAWAKRNGVSVAEIYEDNDVSAYRGKTRPSYRRLCDDLKAGTRDGVIVWHNDRLHRNTRELEDFIDLVEATGAQVATVTSGDYDLTTTTGRAMARIACALARLESEDKSRRLKRQAQQAAEEGRRSGGGTRAYGYRPGHAEIVPEEAAIISEAARRILAGEALR
ncbi:MAG: recombinase family protein, partial [Acidimicrobiales bacterium]